jgi:hypothetical protein
MTLRVRYRPLRIGWCVRSDEFEGLGRVLRVTHTLWGGRFNPVLPVDDPRQAERIDWLRDAHLRTLDLAPMLRRPWQYQGQAKSVTVWCRDCGDASAIPSSTLPIERVPVPDAYLCSTTPEPPVAHSDERFVLGALDTQGYRPTLTFQLPEKPFYIDQRSTCQLNTP